MARGSRRDPSLRGRRCLNRVREAQVGTLNLLLDPQRMARLLEAEAMGDDAYALGTMLDDLRDGIWRELDGGDAIGPYRRNLQRGYLERMDHLMTAEVESEDVPDWYEDYVIMTPVDVSQSDIRAYVRSELETLRGEVERGLRRTTDETTEIHLEDVLVRIERILDPKTVVSGEEE
ncbi:MAG TPA: zinc-dependent metalloprotease [Salinibacter sp.]|nr:zinc-dependent metalloprotease [Salinibacter sp.]